MSSTADELDERKVRGRKTLESLLPKANEGIAKHQGELVLAVYQQKTIGFSRPMTTEGYECLGVIHGEPRVDLLGNLHLPAETYVRKANGV